MYRRMRKALIREIAPDTVLDWVAPNHSPGGALLTGGLSTSDRHSSCYAHTRPRSNLETEHMSSLAQVLISLPLVAGACQIAACALFRIASSRCMRASAASPPAVAW
jgi:hypothetical protein